MVLTMIIQLNNDIYFTKTLTDINTTIKSHKIFIYFKRAVVTAPYLY
jgi:hypothetical protein